MTYFGVDHSNDTIRRAINEHVRDDEEDCGSGSGTTWPDLEWYVEDKAEFETVGPSSGWSIDGISSQVAQGRPVLLLVHYKSLPGHEGSTNEDDHFIVFQGIRDDGLVSYDDPAFSSASAGNNRTMTQAQLTTAWTSCVGGNPQRSAMAVYPAPIPMDDAIREGLAYLREHQAADGSWSSDVGITALAALAFLNYGYDEADQYVQDAIQYILSNVKPDGRISNGYDTYHTSIAILPLVATHNSDYNDEINDAKNWLVDAQNDETFGYSPGDYQYGGWTYGSYKGDPDLSNTQWALLGLDAAGLPKSDAAWTKAITYVQRCQNKPASNDQDWAHDVAQPAYDDAGFIYRPSGWSLAGGTLSYGSMTGAGIWSFALCGLDPTDAQMGAGIDWFANNYSWDYNPKTGGSWGNNALYYYYTTMAKALTMARKTRIGGFLGIGGHDWYKDLSNNLTGLQRDDGSWLGSTHQENNPVLATAYSLLALETRTLPPEVPLSMSIILHSPADPHLYDAQGRHVGKNYDTGEIDLQIPGASYSLGDPQIISITQPTAGNYTVLMIGTDGGGDYQLDIVGTQESEVVSFDTYTGTIAVSETQASYLNVTAMAGALTIFSSQPEAAPLLSRSPSALELSGRPRDTLVASFTVSEVGGSKSVQDVSCFASDLVGESEGRIPGDSITIEPSSFDLAAGQSKVVTVTLPLSTELAVGLYSGDITIESTNAGARSLGLSVAVFRGRTVYFPLILRNYTPVRADFTASPTTGPAPLTVAFTNTSTGAYTDSLWYFGDGATSTQTSPTHIYTETGSYTVTLTVSGPDETDTLTRPNYITVSNVPVAPSNLQATPISGSQIQLDWQDNSSNETGFTIYDGVTMTNVASDTISYTAGELESGSYHCFHIRAFNDHGDSDWSDWACTTTPSCAEGIANGGFEDDGDWELVATPYLAGYTTAAAHTGNRSMRAGIVEPADNLYSHSIAQQTVTIAAGVVSATLRFWLYPLTGESPAKLTVPSRPLAATIEEAPLASDRQYVIVLNEYDQWIRTLIWQRTNDQQWTAHQFDMGVHAGKTIKLQFGVYNDGWDGVTAMYVDDVSLELCGAAAQGSAVYGGRWPRGGVIP